MVNVTIDGRQLEAKEGTTILNVARNNNIFIPTLCYHENIGSYGACRLCLVEIERSGKKRLVASCLYQVEDGLVVETGSERVAANRRTIMELLLARCPGSEAVALLAKKLGVAETPFRKAASNCVLCGLCARACEEVVGQSAISLVNRGTNREVASPFYEQSENCIGCGSCVYVCPVNAITIEDRGDTRIMTVPNPNMPRIEFKLKKCKKCGHYWAPEKQLDFIAKKLNISSDLFDYCPDCRD